MSKNSQQKTPDLMSIPIRFIHICKCADFDLNEGKTLVRSNNVKLSTLINYLDGKVVNKLLDRVEHLHNKNPRPQHINVITVSHEICHGVPCEGNFWLFQSVCYLPTTQSS